MKSTAILIAAAAAALAGAASAQPPAAKPPGAAPAAGARPAVPAENPQRSPLLWREEWKQATPDGKEGPLSLTGSISNPDLEMKLYGPGAKLQILGKNGDDGNPAHVFSGEATSQLAFAFHNKKGPADLTGLSRIRANTKMSGLHKIYPIVKLASGDWYMADKGLGGSTTDWVVEEAALTGVRWYKLDIERVVTKGNPVDKIDLSKVDEIGFADLIPASGHGPGGWIDVGPIEVFGKLAK